ncbi:MAG: COG2833: uncharacterized protein [uncultured Campylobacterales bacterium]|uniref:COG2833: uncharacterized protein n=1 Tax=uncultured Campylobacterales bacterium TaxID=352960 RepID=A0A6S6SCL9_9BACT|nr:MAG: COG2833: uncharacterized protein [uncultured Campylobacterales bacterium]
MEFFSSLEAILTSVKPEIKIAKFNEFFECYKTNKTTFKHNQESVVFSSPSYSEHLNVVHAKKLSKRSKLGSIEGKAYLCHSVAHIEYSAIDLALDTAYRFKNQPKEFYDDWIDVANDEIRHFLSLEKLLVKYGYTYGSFDVHSFLFETSMRCLDIVSRIAVVPRYLEASGLDSSPKVIAKLGNINDEFAKELKQSIEIILKEEVSHVKKGDFWFKYFCEQKGIDPKSYFDIVETVLPGAKKKKPYVNVSARLKSGFTQEEIDVLI